jgi:hypothetical protein
MKTLNERELIELEEQFWQSMIDKDVETAKRLTDEPCILTGAQGVHSIDRETFGRMMADESSTLHDYAISDVETEQVSDDVAVIGYKVREHLTVDGKPLTLDAADSSVWVRKNGGWVCALHTESILGDPFGRDRAGAAA